MKSPSARPAFWYHPWPSVFQPVSLAAGSMTPTTSDSTACTDCLTGFARTWRSFHRPRRQHPGWPSPADTPPTPCASQCSTVLLRSYHSSPTCGLVIFVNRITPPLRSTFITKASTLLRAAPPLTPASVFFLMVSDRGRDARYRAPPAQIRTCPIRAYGSYLGCLTANRWFGHG
jgi:hypothetical protein